MCPHLLTCITCPQCTHTGPQVYVLVVVPSQPQAHVCRNIQTHKPTLGQTYSHEHTYMHGMRQPAPLDICHPSGTESQPTGPTTRDMKQMRSPRLCASPRLVSTTVRATCSCWHDTGSHCAARPRGTMGAYFLPVPTTLPGSLGLGAQPPVSEGEGNSPEASAA